MITQRQLLKSAIIAGAACLGLGSVSLSAMAITVFNFGDSTNFPATSTETDTGLPLGATSYSVTKDGITATLGNYTRDNLNDGDPTFVIDSNANGTGRGIMLVEDLVALSSLYSFNLTFDKPVQILSFTLRSMNADNVSLQFGGGSSASINDFFTTSPPQTIPLDNSPFVLSANQTISTLANNKIDAPGQGDSYLAEITVQAVPFESDVLPLVGATILFGGGMWWKRRRGTGQLDLTGQRVEKEQDNG